MATARTQLEAFLGTRPAGSAQPREAQDPLRILVLADLGGSARPPLAQRKLRSAKPPHRTLDLETLTEQRFGGVFRDAALYVIRGVGDQNLMDCLRRIEDIQRKWPKLVLHDVAAFRRP